MKKKYVKPSMRVFKLTRSTSLLSGSPNGWGGEGGYLPTIPGQPDDANHLA